MGAAFQGAKAAKKLKKSPKNGLGADRTRVSQRQAGIALGGDWGKWTG
jgi:hypothetical protein